MVVGKDRNNIVGSKDQLEQTGAAIINLFSSQRMGRSLL